MNAKTFSFTSVIKNKTTWVKKLTDIYKSAVSSKPSDALARKPQKQHQEESPVSGNSLFHDGGCYHIETSPLICRANQWTGF